MDKVFMQNQKLLSSDLFKVIRENTFETEKLKKLSPEVLAGLYEMDAMRVMVPEEYGGLAWPLPKIVSFFETLAQADGNVGWVVNLVAGANMFAGYLEKDIAQHIFSDRKVGCAGSGAPSGKAIKTQGGFILSGKWKYASGSAHATHFTANAFLYEQDNPVIGDNGKEFLSFIFPKEEVEIYNTWQTTGLCATSSNEFEVKNIFVPNNRSFSLTAPSPHLSNTIYRFHFELLAVLNMAVMPIGMGLHFIECYEELLKNKKPLNSASVLNGNTVVQQINHRVIPSFFTERENMYRLLDNLWGLYEEGVEVSSASQLALAKQARKAAEKAREMLFSLYPICGMNMAFPTEPLNKIWRDMSVASQHYLLFPQ